MSRDKNLQDFWRFCTTWPSLCCHARVFSRRSAILKIVEEKALGTRLHFIKSSFSSPEPTILLACGRNRELWEQPFWNNKGNNRILPIRSHSLTQFSSPEPTCLLVCKETLGAAQKARGLWERDWGSRSLHLWRIGACLKWLLPELSIPAAGQKDRRLWGRECFGSSQLVALRFTFVVF